MKRTLLACLVLVLTLTGAVLLPRERVPEPPPFRQHEAWPRDCPDQTGLDEETGLTTHLPIVILHTDGMEVPGQLRADQRKLLCSYSVIRHEDGLNNSGDAPTQQGLAEISIRGNSSRTFPKKQYALKTVKADGTAKQTALLDMPAGSSWVLNGSFADASMIRNYLLYTLSDEIMAGYVPRCRMCEVLMTDAAGNLTYEGVYTLVERPAVAENRLDLQPWSPNYRETSFMLQMNSHIDKYELQHLQPKEISTYSYDLEYPDIDEISRESLDYIEQEVLIFEKLLYDADRTGDWSRLEQVLDLDSFVDYYLINEFFQNYDAGMRSTYIYRNVGGPLTIGPVWDFDGAFNNFFQKDFEPDDTALNTSFFYYYLVRDPQFVTRCARRYRELRQDLLSDTHLQQAIDDCSRYLGTAAQRERSRWHQSSMDRMEQDLEKMKQFVADRGACLDALFAHYHP